MYLLQKLTLFFIILLTVSFTLQAENDGGYKIRKVVIDAGHGGKDPGAVGKKGKEKDIALKIALKLGKYIKQNIKGVEIIYTRKTDVFIELFRRSEIANENNADLFISIHVNASRKKSIKGTATYVMGLAKASENLELAKRENSVILKEHNYKSKYSGFDPNSPESDIMLSLVQNAYLEQSILLADKVQTQFAKRAGRKNRDVRQANLVVLWNCTMPSILVETGFITNPSEEKYLMTDRGQSIIASAIFRAFRDYKNAVEGNNIKYEKKREIHSAKNRNSVKKKGLSNKKLKHSTKKTTENSKNSKNIVYKVQIAYSVKNLNTHPRNFKGIKGIKKEKRGKKYRYTLGNTHSFAEIVELQNKVRKKYSGAYVIAFKNGKEIDLPKN